MTYSLYSTLSNLDKENNKVAHIALLQWDAYKHDVIKSIDLKALLMEEMPMTFQREDPKAQGNPWHDKDLRIKALTIKNFRGVPINIEEMIPYGISLSATEDNNKQTVTSLILLGANGTGKTSIYSALEYMWIGSTSIERKHQIKEEKKETFYRHVKNRNIPSEIKTILEDGTEFSLEKTSLGCISELVDLKNFFCSESDLAIIECSGGDIAKYVEGEIGIGELVELKGILEELQEEAQKKYKEIASNETNSDEDKYELHRLDQLSDDIKNATIAISNKIKEVRNTVLSDSQVILENILSDYSDGNEDVEPSYDLVDSKKLFNGSLQLRSNPAQKFSPREYFNNFRFKMYLVSIRVAIAFYIMKSRKINFPLVFDDIFDSSDFQNRVNTRRFIRKIINTYYNLKISEKSLQVIFFTQDEIIAQSIYEGATKSTSEFTHTLNAILGRLFPPSQAKEQDKVSLTTITPKMDVNNTESEKKQLVFYNLYDTIQCR